MDATPAPAGSTEPHRRPGRVRPPAGWRLAASGLFLLLGLTACRHGGGPGPAPGPDLAATTAPVPEDLVQTRLSDYIDREADLFRELEAAPDTFKAAEVTSRIQQLCRDYEALIAANPYEIYPVILYGKLLRRVGERDRAHEMFQRANALDTHLAVVKQQLGNYFAEEGNTGAALGFYLAAVELEPGEAAYHYTLGEFYFSFREQLIADGAHDRAACDRIMLRSFAEAARLAPDQVDYLYRYAESFADCEQPDWAAALAAWERLQPLAQPGLPTSAVQLQRARALALLGRAAEARALAEPVTEPALQASRAEVLALAPAP